MRTHDTVDSAADSNMDEKFVELVKKHSKSEKQKETQSAKAIEARRNWWIKEVTALFAQVKGWLDQLIKDGTLTFETVDVPINDGWLGSYIMQRAISQRPPVKPEA